MGQVSSPQSPPGIILEPVDRLIATNADGGVPPGVSHIIMFGEDAGQNSSLDGVIAMGAFSFDGGLNITRHEGSIAIGMNAGSAVNLQNNTVPTGDASLVIIGYNAAALAQRMDTAVIIGGGALEMLPAAGANGVGNMVVIGNAAMGAVDSTGAHRDSVVIGSGALYRALGSSPSSAGSTLNVIIGANAARDNRALLSGSVIIGYQAALGVGNTASVSNNVIIGNGACDTTNLCDENVAIGASCVIASTGVSTQARRNVVLGMNATARGSGNVVIGYAAITAGSSFGDNNIILGNGAGNGLAAGVSNQLLIESNDGTRRAIAYADMATGSLVVGNSVPATDRDLPGTNILKLLNGTATGTPIGGGFFFVTAGQVSWRGSNGRDYGLPFGGSRGTFTVATLPAAATAGERAYVTDALAPAFAAAVAGGGAVFTPVYYSGAAWLCG